MWLKEIGFKEQIENWWKGMQFQGVSSFNMMQKLNFLKTKLRTWNKEFLGRVDVRMK